MTGETVRGDESNARAVFDGTRLALAPVWFQGAHMVFTLAEAVSGKWSTPSTILGDISSDGESDFDSDSNSESGALAMSGFGCNTAV